MARAKLRSYIPDIVVGLAIVGVGAFVVSGQLSKTGVASTAPAQVAAQTPLAPVVIEEIPPPAAHAQPTEIAKPGSWAARTKENKLQN